MLQSYLVVVPPYSFFKIGNHAHSCVDTKMSTVFSLEVKQPFASHPSRFVKLGQFKSIFQLPLF